ncbi:hypothetical protein ZHAS_00004253 [Anopheles sinensis]|uniref:SUEL-type lectin domain-containing protein n=1 Tax=Anopheles sinensis TaxID=74873 RepID=A0A084VGG3_ANOSI|nr:hypothetical protein ZHAS_00004253 [Anopheles sinensis]
MRHAVSRNVFRERYITPLEEDELDERPYESNELYDEELTPAPNQIESTGKAGVGTSNHNKYSSVGGGGDSAVKAENIVTFSKGACLSEHTSHTLTEICQGRRKCTVAVESSTFGNPCPENARTYLKVIYACGK